MTHHTITYWLISASLLLAIGFTANRYGKEN